MDIINSGKIGIKVTKPRSFGAGEIFVKLAKILISYIGSVLIFSLIFKGFNIECDYALMYKIILAATLIYSVLQINIFVLIGGCIFGGIKIYSYVIENIDIIESGVKSILNSCYPIISSALSLPTADGFESVLPDVYKTVNSVSGIVAAVIAVISVIIVVKFSSKILYGLGITGVFAVLSFFECEYGMLSVFALILCLVSLIILGLNNLNTFKIIDFKMIYNKISEIRGKTNNKTVKLRADLPFFLHIAVWILVVFVAAAGILYGLNGQNLYDKYSDKSHSDNIKIAAKDIAVMKYAEYLKFTVNDNVSYGQLGYISLVKPDVNANVFKYAAPASDSKRYFVNFVGKDYNYRYNTWSEDSDDNSAMVNALISNGAKSTEYKITSYGTKAYYPYYSVYALRNFEKNIETAVTAYEYRNITINDSDYNSFVYENYLGIDDKNKEVLDKICSANGFTNEDPDISQKLQSYLAENYTYTNEVDTLAYGTDFLNNFLEITHSGNFVHYATALTMLYRNIGIPARYVSGYVVDSAQGMENYNRNTGLCTVNVKKANINSWVEIYSENGGWQIIEPFYSPSFEELQEEYGTDTTETGAETDDTYTPNTDIKNYFVSGDTDAYSPRSVAKGIIVWVLKIIGLLLVCTLIILVIVCAVIFIRRKLKYITANNSGKAYIIMENLKKKICPQEPTYKSMLKFAPSGIDKKLLCDIILLGEKCIFSQSVDDDEIRTLKKKIKELKI